MKNCYFLVLFCCLFISSFAQTQVSVGGAATTEVFNDVKYDASDGSTVNVGYIGVNGVGNGTDCYWVKLNASKQIVWQKTIPNVGNDFLSRVQICANGDYITSGVFTQGGLQWGIVCRINSTTGNIIWSSTSVGTASAHGDQFYNLIETTSGDIAIVGSTDFISGPVNSMIVLLSSSGVQKWCKVSDFNSSDEIQTVNQLTNGNLIVCGHYFDLSSRYVAFVMELDEPTGSIINKNDYAISINDPTLIGNTVNTLWPTNGYINGGDVTFSMGVIQGCCGPGSDYAIYSYNKTTKALTGNLYYHKGYQSVGYCATAVVNSNDYIITQAIVNPSPSTVKNLYVSRITNGVVAYDRRVNTADTYIASIDINGNNLFLSGVNQINSGDGYSLFSTTAFPSSTGSCVFPDADSLLLLPSTPAQFADTISLNNVTGVMIPLVPSVTPANGVAVILCTSCADSSIIDTTICQGQNYLGYDTTGTYIDTLVNVKGCDSIRTLNLTIKLKSFSTIDTTICQGQNYLGHDTTGIYIDTLTNVAGCDSIRTLNLTINNNCTPPTCDTSLWRAWTSSTADGDGINCVSLPISASQFIANGIAHVPASLGCYPYHWSSIQMRDTMCITNNFTFEVRARDPASGGGIDSYDFGITLTGSGISSGCQLEGSNSVKGPVWAQQFTTAYVGADEVTNNPALVMNFDDWHIITLTYKDNVLYYSRDDTTFFQLPYTGNICNIESITLGFKGTGDFDWVRILDANGNEVWREDFDSCSALKPFPPCVTTTPVINLSYTAPTCADDTLRLFAAANQLISYNWTGPNGFTSTEQNPIIDTPTIAANGVYTVTGLTNNCAATTTTQSITVSVPVLPRSFSTKDTTICFGQSYGGHGASGTYIDTLTNAAGCDSVITLNLTVIPKSFSTLDTTICQGQSFRGHVTTGTYVDTIQNVAGCDSIITLNLTISNNCTSNPTCNGSLGKPVVNITFGNGSNPGPPLTAGTTSYTYIAATGTPPSNIVLDGDYSIVNEVPANSSWFQGAKDHTGDPNGYMAFFNASANTGIFYQQTVTNLCPGTTYQFSAWIANAINAATNFTNLPNITMELVNPDNNAVVGIINTGNIPNSFSMTWLQYGVLFTMPAGLNSITLVLSNNNAGGDSNPGNDLAIDDITFSPCGPQTTASFSSGSTEDSVCYNTPVNLSGTVSSGLIAPAYQWQISTDNRVTFTDIAGATNLNYVQSGLSPGQYEFQLLSAETGNINSPSCRFVSNNINLTVKPLANSTITTAICEGDSYLGYTTGGTYIDTLVATNGCDSIRTLNLTIKPKSFFTIPAVICEGQNYLGYTTAGAHIDTLVAANGCDSIRTINLIVKPKSFSTTNASICQGKNYLGYTATGTYVDTLVASNGCDSIRTLNLSVTPYPRSSVTAIICSGDNYAGYTTTGVYIDTLITTDGCDSIRTINLTVKLKSFVTIDTSICQGNSFLGYSSTGNYINTIPNAAGCDSIITLNLTVIPIPIVKTNNDTSICKGTPLQLNTTGATTYSWAPLNALTFPDNTSDPIVNTITPIQYIVTGTANGCSASDTLNVGVNPLPVISKSNDVTICEDSTTVLYANGGLAFQWSPTGSLSFPNNVNDPVASPLVSTTYHVVVTDANNCMNSDSIKVSIRPRAVFTVSPDAGACANISTQLLAGGGDIYLWSPAALVSNAGIRNPTTSITSTTTYNVQIKENTCGTSATLYTTLTLLPALSVSASKSNDLDCYVSAATLSASGADKYLWSPSSSLNDANIANPIAKPFSTQKYIVTGTDELGCTGYDSVTVYGNFADRLVYNMANAFTPNNDGKNDCYGIEYFGPISDFTFIIYNRWGQEMFSTNNPSACWNGTFQGQDVGEGAYVYYIKAVTACGTTEKKGTVVLIR